MPRILNRYDMYPKIPSNSWGYTYNGGNRLSSSENSSPTISAFPSTEPTKIQHITKPITSTQHAGLSYRIDDYRNDDSYDKHNVQSDPHKTDVLSEGWGYFVDFNSPISNNTEQRKTSFISHHGNHR